MQQGMQCSLWEDMYGLMKHLSLRPRCFTGHWKDRGL